MNLHQLFSIFSQRKDEHYYHLAKKLNNLQSNAMTYWSIPKTFFNGTKIPVASPLLIDGKLVSDLKKKLIDLMNFLVVSVHLLTIVVNVQVSLFLLLIRIVFDDKDIIKIIRALSINKSHDHDDISIRMIKSV